MKAMYIRAAAVLAFSLSAALNLEAQDEPPKDEIKRVERNQRKVREQEEKFRDQEAEVAVVADKIRAEVDRVEDIAHNFNFDHRVVTPFGGKGDIMELVSSSSRASAPPLIVRNNPDPEIIANLQEDLAVMSRILNKTVGKENPRDQAMGIMISSSSSRNRASAMYFEGYGAVFNLSVKFPLVAPPTKKETKDAKPTDSTWEEAKRELSSTGGGAGGVFFGNRGEERTVSYDPDQVADLKESLITAFKHAANIRDLKGDEQVVITVSGGGTGGAHAVMNIQPPNPPQPVLGDGGGKPGPAKSIRATRVMTYSSSNGSASGKSSTLVLRAKKSDIDAFASGKKSLDEFKNKVQVQTY